MPASIKATLLAVSLCLTCGLLTPPEAVAQEPEKKDFQVSTNASLATDYRFRGFTQTRESMALQGGLDAAYRFFYIGAWGTNVDFGKVTDVSGRQHQVADFEVQFFGGIKPKLRGNEFDFGVIYYAFPGSYGNPRDLEYVELKAGVSRELHKNLTAGLYGYWSPDYFGSTGNNTVVQGSLTRKFDRMAYGVPSISGNLGYSFGTESKGGLDYGFWNVGSSLIFADYFAVDLRYYNTFDVPSTVSCDNRCDGKVVVTLTFEN
jgi:uncharacterized protein (TIGR02001 family)